MTEPESALPSVRARVIAFSAILVAGALGGATAYWFVDLQCTGDCTLTAGFMMLLGTAVFAIGTATVAVLSLRALAEWTGQHR